MSESYGPRERIRQKRDFTALYRRGRSYRSPCFTLIILPNARGYSRMAAVSSRKVGDAVRRNRARRRARELFRRNKSWLKTSVDMLIITRRDLNEAGWDALHRQYLEALSEVFQERRPR